MIRFDNVSKVFGEGQTRVDALRGLSLQIPARQFCTIMGPSGSGKSTVLHLVARLTKPTEGEIYLGDRPLSGMAERDAAMMRRREIGFVFQFFHLIPYLSAEENVSLPLLLDGLSSASVRQQTERVLTLVDLLHRRRHKPSELSGGEMQRVAIARALVTSPRVILADEPTGNLDSRTSVEVMAILQDLNRQGITVVLVTHEADIVPFAARTITFRDGRVLRDEVVAETRDARQVLATLPVEAEDEE